MAEDDDNKTEEPTGKKLSDARKEGDVMQSMEVKQAAGLLAIMAMMWLILPSMLSQMKAQLGEFLAQVGTLRADTSSELHHLSAQLALNMALLVAAPFALFVVVGIITQLIQVGWELTPQKLIPDLNKINPLNGLKRFVSAQMAVELIKGVAKLLVVGVVCVLMLRPHLHELENLISMPLDASLIYLHRIIIRLLFTVLMTVVVISGLDWMWTRYSFMKRQRMTKQEVKDENRQSEGDPMVKSRIRSLRMQRARQRMMAAVPKADVVVTNPTHFACALKYDQSTMRAPVLVAKGQDLVALRIRQVADDNNIPIVENPPLARALYAAVDLDREIPPEHYKAVAEVISYVFRLRKIDRRYRR